MFVSSSTYLSTIRPYANFDAFRKRENNRNTWTQRYCHVFKWLRFFCRSGFVYQQSALESCRTKGISARCMFVILQRIDSCFLFHMSIIAPSTHLFTYAFECYTCSSEDNNQASTLWLAERRARRLWIPNKQRIRMRNLQQSDLDILHVKD